MPDWTKSMEQSFEYYIVDPATWKDSKRIDNVIKATINRDASAETLGSATFDVSNDLEECYIRTYLVTIQNGVTEKHALGTMLIQTPSLNFDGVVSNVSIDAYTPLLELKENPPPIGYSLLKDENIMDTAFRLVREQARAPVVKTVSDRKLFEHFIAETSDTWLTFITALIANAKYELALDELGRILFSPKQELASLQPVWTYTDDNSSILLPSISVENDLFDIPNVVEVVYSNGNNNYYSVAINDDPDSPTSTVNRGRKITHRVTDLNLIGDPTEAQIDEYAKQTLKEKSTIECQVSYTHGYCPVRLGDCVRLNYQRAGLTGVKAKVISQSISCEPGCPVSETAVFTKKLWG